jgi:hypothetical protein
MAMASEHIFAQCIEAVEFPDLSREYQVMAVPRTVINDHAFIEGALPESMFVNRIIDAVSENPTEQKN